jgi:hypothetical protein
VGINPSIVIPLIYIDFFTNWIRKKLNLKNFLPTFTGFLSFILWSFISNKYQSVTNYGKFNFDHIYLNFIKTINSIQFSLDFGFVWLIVITLLLVAYGAFKFNVILKNKTLLFLSFIFSIGWFILFSQSKWVEMNLYSWRYFTYAYYSTIILIFLLIVPILKEFKQSYLKFILVLLILIQLFPKKIEFIQEWQVFKSVNENASSSVGLYAGDYWVVWPVVFKDMMAGQKAYGLAFRGESNKKPVVKNISDQVFENGFFYVECLNASKEVCEAQIKDFVGDIKLLDINKKSDNSLTFKMTY